MSNAQLQVKEGLTIRQAMDALVAANPGYQWELKDGAVDLMPRGAAPLLRTRIAKFQMNATDLEIPSLLQDVLRHPEVREREPALGLKGGIHAGPGGGGAAVEKHPVPRQPVPVHINLQNLSLQAAFNKIVELTPDGVWIYRETHCNGAKTFTVEMESDD